MFNFFRRLTPQQAIKLLEPIPKEEFTTTVLWDGNNKCCSLGHLNRLLSKDPTNYVNAEYTPSKVMDFSNRVRKFINKKSNQQAGIITVNDYNTVNGYNEGNPKDRIIHLFTEMSK